MVRTLIAAALLLCAGWQVGQHAPAHGADVHSDQSPVGTRAMTWVRTSEGWERTTHWFRSPSRSPTPTLHPFVVAAGQILGSLLALLAFSEEIELHHLWQSTTGWLSGVFHRFDRTS